MTQWKNIATVVGLSVTAALAGTGCMAQGADEDEATDDSPVAAAAPAEESQSPTAGDEKTDEKTGDAKQAWLGGGFGGWGDGLGGWGGGFGGGFGGWGGGFGGWGGGFGGWGGGFGGGWGGGFGGCGIGCATPIISAATVPVTVPVVSGFAVPVVSTAIIPACGCGGFGGFGLGGGGCGC